ncbi:MAG: hypothetical protein HOW73_10115 [Polyangiaceae bacterium]|nr:hypothetical protein [Polyangiaceae bacterium]
MAVGTVLALSLGIAGILFVGSSEPTGGLEQPAPPMSPAPTTAPIPLEPDAPPPQVDNDVECEPARGLVFPTGEAPALACDQARRIVAQARSNLATPAEPVDRKRFVFATSDWLDPHGLWSVAPDAPVQALLTKVGPSLLAELEAAPGSGPCAAAEQVGQTLATWVGSVRKELLDARALGQRLPIDPKKRWEIASSTPFEDGKVTRPGRELARLLGHGIGSIEHAYGADLGVLADAAVARTVPEKTPEEWSKIVLAAAVRAYVPQVDPHGAWAPLDEETSIYDLDLEVDPPPRLWSDMTRTSLGVRIDEGAHAPLKNGDVVLRIGTVAVAGLSVEQANQLSIIADPEPIAVTYLRAGATRPTAVEVSPEMELLSVPPPAEELAGLEAHEVSYGKGYVLVVKIGDVPDDLGARLSSVLFERPHMKPGTHGDRPLGVLLDLRGNGGGSTDGALAALGMFLPGAALFPMKRRDGEIEIDRAPKPREESRWSGPVAALVDGDSASAAEMLAGALAAYDRGVVLGSRTYGKGCAQEYLDDDVGSGVLRLTTLVFALPDGSPLQRVGVSPHVALGLPATGEAEEKLLHAPTTWRGPDVRDKDLMKKVPWPDHEGRVGVCEDETIHRALRALGTTRAAAR